MASSSPAPDRLRILAVMARPLYPADTGGRIRSSQLFERLSRLHHVTILCFRNSEDRAEHLDMMRACCSRLETIDWVETPKFTARFYAELAAGVCSPLPYTVRKYRSHAMQRRTRDLLASGDYDLLLCDFLQPAINCIDVPFRPKVLFEHNVEAVIRRRQARHESNPFIRTFLAQEAWKLSRFESRAAFAFDHCIMVSDEDCQTMERAYGARNTSAIPTGVDVDYFQPGTIETPEPRIVFVGSMDWLPNQDAVEFLVRDVLPRIERQLPTPPTLYIVGRNPPASILRLAGSRVVVTGTVEDVRPYVAAASVCVVPIRIGGGTRIKIFEALAMEKAVVSTPVGAEGLPVSDGENILLASDAEAFAAAVVRVLSDPSLRGQLGAAGRRLVSERHTWDAAAQRFSQICVDLVQNVRLQSGDRPASIAGHMTIRERGGGPAGR